MGGLETVAAQEVSPPDPSFFASIEWIDWTAIFVVGVFFVLGLFKGFVWQASRVLSLVAAYVVAGIYGARGASLINRWWSDSAAAPEGLTLYISYVTIFLGVVALLSVAAHFVQKLIKKSGLSFYDRVGGGFLGIATGGCVMIFFLSIVYMFLDDFAFAQTARESKSMAVSQRALRVLGDVVPEPLQELFKVDKKTDEEQNDPGRGRNLMIRDPQHDYDWIAPSSQLQPSSQPQPGSPPQSAPSRPKKKDF